MSLQDNYDVLIKAHKIIDNKRQKDWSDEDLISLTLLLFDKEWLVKQIIKEIRYHAKLIEIFHHSNLQKINEDELK